MYLPPSDLPPERAPSPPALVSMAVRSDVLWNRPVFKAPPLVVAPPKLDPKAVAEELRRGLHPHR